jgi:cobalt-zinc-cadmium efflux system membrane fusion protein
VVTDPKHLWIDLDVAEKDFKKITLGQNFRVVSDAYPNVTFSASAVFIGKVMDPQTRRVTVHCVLNDDSERLKPEMFVRATPLGGNVLRPRVPNTALISEGLKTFLFVERTPGEIQKREVTLAYRGHDDSYIENGLNTGERVVTSGALLLNAEMQGD